MEKIKLNYKKMSQARESIKQRTLEELWTRGGHLKRILDSNQYEMYDKFHAYGRSKSSRFVFLCSRRLGKSVLAFALCDEFCRTNPGSRILFLSKTTENLTEIVDQASSVFLATCPEHMKPEYKVKQAKYVYDNGSEIRFKGMDKAGPDSIRGVKAQLVIFDEFSFMDNLTKLIKSAVGPMINEQKGRMLLISSAPESPGHESIDFIQEAEINGSLIKKTIYDCPRWTPEDIEEFARDAGGFDSDEFRREYMCEIITDRNRAILPACTEEHMKSIVKEWEKPTDYMPDHYISIDPGGRDQTAILFGYYDYLEATLIIEEEALLDSASTEDIKAAIDKKLSGDWKGIEPYRIIMDNNNLILVKDMKKLHGMSVKATKKDKKEAQVNHTNLMIRNEQIIIHPSCKNLIQQCRYGIWNATRTSYDRSPSLSHCDAVDALVYLVRNINKSKNPIPSYTPNPDTTIRHEYTSDNKDHIFQKLFKRRR